MGLVRLGRYQEARDRLERDVKAFPEQLGFAHALARLLAAAPDDRVRNGARAHAMVMELLKNQRTPALAETMAMAQAELGRFKDAVEWQRTAIDLARSAGRPEGMAHLTENLALYQSRTALPHAVDQRRSRASSAALVVAAAASAAAICPRGLKLRRPSR